MAQTLSYAAGLYMRLSKDDEGSSESSSISTQRNILREFAKAHNITVGDEYIDDGYSGTNYDRPDFRRMIADIEDGRINCVITKDLSRLGRNSAKTSELLDEYFPSRGIRYIAVIEGYDSLNLTNGTLMTAPFMLLMNEMYARDISGKIRSSLHIKMEKGDYIGSFAPYGYKKDIEHGNKNHLVIDYQVSYIVQVIFRMAYEGKTPKEIADNLNNAGIAAPAVYRSLKRPYLGSYSNLGKWTSSSVCKMLRNRVYLGHTQQGKTTKVSFKSRDIRTNSREEWIEVKNTHEPLVTEEMYRIVRNRCTARRNQPANGFKNIFSGIAKCADCGHNMTTVPSRTKGTVCNLACGSYKSRGKEVCSNHFIDYGLLYNIVLQEIKFWISRADGDIRTIEEEAVREKYNSTVIGEVNKSERRMQEVTLLIKKIYEDFSFGRISEEMYKKLSEEYEAEYKSLKITAKAAKNQLHPENNSSYDFPALINEMRAAETLSDTLLKNLIGCIEVEQGEYDGIKRQCIKIYYRFIGNV